MLGEERHEMNCQGNANAQGVLQLTRLIAQDEAKILIVSRSMR